MTQDPTDKSVDQTASTLNELIQTCKDGESGFRAAGESVEDSNLCRLFESYVQQRWSLPRSYSSKSGGLRKIQWTPGTLPRRFTGVGWTSKLV